MTIIVLETSGKSDSVDYAQVHLFDDKLKAEEFVKAFSQLSKKKYWRRAMIVEPSKEYELEGIDHDEY